MNQTKVLSQVLVDWNRGAENRAYALLDISEDTPLPVAHEIAECAGWFRGSGIAGVNYSGDDKSDRIEEYFEVLKEVRNRRIPLTVHLGEFRSAMESMRILDILRPLRIGHGTNLARDKRVVQFLQENQMAVELCLTSNLMSGAVSSTKDFPIRSFLEGNVSVSINTDDPEILGIQLVDEYRTLLGAGLITMGEITSINQRALATRFGGI